VGWARSASGWRFEADGDAALWADARTSASKVLALTAIVGVLAVAVPPRHAPFGLQVLAMIALVIAAPIAIASLFRVRKLSIDAGRLAWRSLLRAQSVALEDVVRFHVQDLSSDGSPMYAIVVDLAPDRSAKVWTDPSAAKVRILCAWLNAAAFAVTAPSAPAAAGE
jgi:hypothetical protein